MLAVVYMFKAIMYKEKKHKTYMAKHELSEVE